MKPSAATSRKENSCKNKKSLPSVRKLKQGPSCVREIALVQGFCVVGKNYKQNHRLEMNNKEEGAGEEKKGPLYKAR